MSLCRFAFGKNQVIIKLMNVEKTMQFILDMQAQLTASAQKHDERLSRLESVAAQHDERLTRLEASVATVTDLVGRLAQAEIRLVERMDRLAQEMERLGESQAYTDQRLNALIDIVDKLIQRNGSAH